MKRLALAVCLLFALPLVAHEEREVILVLVDQANNRAYIPEGTVLPPHVQLNVRMEKRLLDASEVAQLRGGRDSGRGIGRDTGRSLPMEKAAMSRVKSKPALVLQYAPAERFEAARRNYEAQKAKRPRSPVQSDSSHMTCFDTYVQDSEPGQYGTYYNGFTSTFCQQSSGITVGVANDWEFHATGDYSDTDPYIYPHVYVSDNNNNFNCSDTFAWPNDGSCTAANSTVLLQQGCLNVVDTGSQQYYIEYGWQWEPYYVGFTFFVDYCTYFY